jgi:fermentation-respiration switch protein FrsA (DUF1100 family)
VRDDLVQQPGDLVFVLDQVLAMDEGSGELAGRIDKARIAAAGHSFGAITTLGLRTVCCTDPRISATLLLAAAPPDFGLPGLAADPGARLTGSSVPSLFIHAATDDTIPITEGIDAFNMVEGPKAFVTLTAGGHSKPYYDAGDAEFPIVRDVTTEFIQWAVDADQNALVDLRATLQDSDGARLTWDNLPD